MEIKDILVTGDDGFNSIGLKVLAKAFEKIANVVVCAPDRERSTTSHSMTLHKPLRLIQHEKNIFSVSGTPADSIFLALRTLVKPDIIVSGINIGANLGSDIFYSGTVAGAREGALANIKSYAFSLACDPFRPKPYQQLLGALERASDIAVKVVEETKDVSFPPYSLINVNVPFMGDIKGIRLANQAVRLYGGQIEKRLDPHGREYYWVAGNVLGYEGDSFSDCYLVSNGFVSVVPISIDCTHKTFLNDLKSVFPE